VYARVSTNDQQTLPMQMRAMREYADRRGYSGSGRVSGFLVGDQAAVVPEEVVARARPIPAAQPPLEVKLINWPLVISQKALSVRHAGNRLRAEAALRLLERRAHDDIQSSTQVPKPPRLARQCT
jgi:hypothetical protein